MLAAMKTDRSSISANERRKESGLALKAARKEARMTQAQLAASAGVTQVYVSHIENGTSIAAPDTYDRLMDAVRFELGRACVFEADETARII